MNLLSGFADISIWQLLLVACVALVASILGGVSGYGTGALMPLILVSLVGAEPVVPIIAISALFSNTSRMSAFLKYVHWRRVALVLIAAVRVGDGHPFLDRRAPPPMRVARRTRGRMSKRRRVARPRVGAGLTGAPPPHRKVWLRECKVPASERVFVSQ